MEQSPTPTPNNSDNKKTESEKKNPFWFLAPVAVFILAKGKFVLSLLKFGKFGGAITSMVIFTGTYALMFPISFAIGLAVMIFIHEMGHVFAAKRKGLPVSAPVFIPFLGAFINMKRNPRDAVTEAYIAYGGPLIGTIGATLAFGLGYGLDYPVLYSVAYIGFFINLFNLVPIHPLDGGRISVAITRWLWVIGLVVGLGLVIYLRSIILGIFWVMFAYDLYKKFVQKKKSLSEERLVVSTQYYVSPDTFLQNLTYIPGENHQRDLIYTAFTELTGKHEGKTVVRARWDVIDFEEEMVIMSQAVINRVYAKVSHMGSETGDTSVCITVYIEYQEFENVKYYEVPSATRWKFGLAYSGLIIYLAIMMYLVHEQINLLM
ncbi:site-2 protease family protein [Paenibacillus albiflavus]|uniref:Site-2 protease family protein n=2 Tax=Paenibacillus albiflavus TaxID=2545760 RepID=A0A4R4E7Q9_9BACL|nr:site-2 protease family protein [Paenibacillus albiflavus]